MDRLSAERLIGERQRIQETLTVAILADSNIVGAYFVGSVAESTADEFSDIDIHMAAELSTVAKNASLSANAQRAVQELRSKLAPLDSSTGT